MKIFYTLYENIASDIKIIVYLFKFLSNKVINHVHWFSYFAIVIRKCLIYSLFVKNKVMQCSASNSDVNGVVQYSDYKRKKYSFKFKLSYQ